MINTVILIPPSEGKSPSGRLPPLGRMNAASQVIYERLMAFRGDESQLYGVKGKVLEAACAANRAVLTSPTLPAVERYTGVVYDGIDYPTLSPSAQSFFNNHVRIVSALFGLLKPDDRIPDYKLKIEKLEAAAHWKAEISRQLKGVFVIDLLPQAHQKAVSYDKGARVDFIFLKKGKPVAAGHSGKLIKGRFVRWLCENQVNHPKDFHRFQEDGFRFAEPNFIKTV